MKTETQNRSARLPATLGRLAALGLLFVGLTAPATQASGYQPVQTLTQGGAFPVNGLAGDAFGQVVTFNGQYLFVSSPGSQPGNKSIAGAVFVYRWNGSQYVSSQIITTGGTGDHLGMLQVLSEHDWLVLGAIGTPVGPQVNDAIADQDFRGAALIYRLNHNSGQWELVQTIDNNTPGLAGLSAIENGGIPVVPTEQGANLGLRMALDAERGWLLVSALYQRQGSVMNAGEVFAFQLNPSSGVWELAQTFTNPDGAIATDGFGAGVAVKGRYAMISNGPVVQAPHPGSNSAVYVYRMVDGAWSYVQRLTGSQDDLTPFFFPLMNPDPLDIGDSFGNAIALDENYAVITAPLESRSVPDSIYTGAAYFFRRKPTANGDERWVLTQRVESPDPGSFMFGAFSVALDGPRAVIGDLGRTGPAGPLQGAAHVYERTGNAWERVLTLSDPVGTPSAGFGAGVALGPDNTLAVGSSPFLGFFAPVVFRPPPAAAPPVAAGKVIVYSPAGN
jgi:hypothetical protein